MISKKRKEMGEESWLEYQKQRKINKAKAWKKRNAERVNDWRRRTKQKLIDYKGGVCERCGYNKNYPSCFHFHHKNQNEKSFGISSKGKTRKLEILKKEVDKCELLCANCHAEVHELLYSKQREESKNRHEKWLSLKREVKNDKTKFKNCKKINISNKKIDKNKSKIKINKPSKEELFKLIWEKPTTHIAKDFNVSDKAVEKWVKKYGLSKPSRGYWTKMKNKQLLNNMPL